MVGFETFTKFLYRKMMSKDMEGGNLERPLQLTSTLWET